MTLALYSSKSAWKEAGAEAPITFIMEKKDNLRITCSDAFKDVVLATAKEEGETRHQYITRAIELRMNLPAQDMDAKEAIKDARMYLREVIPKHRHEMENLNSKFRTVEQLMR